MDSELLDGNDRLSSLTLGFVSHWTLLRTFFLLLTDCVFMNFYRVFLSLLVEINEALLS